MKTFRWVLIACRVVSVSLAWPSCTGCTEESGVSGGGTTEAEMKWDDQSRKAMEAASKAATKK